MEIKKYLFPAVFGLTALFAGCSPEESDSNGLTNDELDASFTVTPMNGSTNRLLLNGNTTATTHAWNGARGTDAKVVFFPLAGDYEVSHTVCGKGGVDCVTATQSINVPSDDPSAFNRIEGGTFETAEDLAHWTTFPANVNGAVWSFNNGTATFNGSQNWAVQNLYTTIEVEPGDYLFDMHVSGQGSDQTYLEWYAGYNAPVAGQDYTEGGQILALNTWSGCATTPFSGQLSEVGCGNTMNGVRHFSQAGTVYILIRTASGVGTSNPFSVTIDNVEVRRIN